MCRLFRLVYYCLTLINVVLLPLKTMLFALLINMDAYRHKLRYRFFFLCNFGLEHYISITLHLYSRPLNKLDKFFLQKITFWPGVDGRNLHVLILNYTCISFFSGLIFKTNFSHQGMKIWILIGLLNWLIWFDQVPCIEISSIIDVCCWATTVKKALLYCRALNSTEPVSCPPLMM